MTLTAYVESKRSPVVTRPTTRVYTAPEVTQRSVAADDLVGWLYLPPTSGPHPAVTTLHGSGAYVPQVFSRMLASHGYATLALQYFDADGLPDSLSGIPLEYFQRSIRWLTTRQAVRDDGVGLVGFSRGVEPALLAAADYEGPATVVGYSGSGVIAQEYPPRDFKAAWVRNGKPVAPFSAISAVFRSIRSVYEHDCEVASVRKRVLEGVSATTLERALIPVEKINGPVLLFAGGDDQLWPAPPTIGPCDQSAHAA
ncbi:acyl-CoA thioester hydrolase/BAAT C-terminal domain-containing protein [Haladaptatus halobius]|uniref:acyl-CoA thioester hydrolase/BAAT C-terminal domain-containing protein n=1 Tax=Haladaptatus halobius TaxID=2884875 RepID=UPI001D0A7A43|nr:acyl-CoA thioester hydrolase/BAAT C-terminal domain-containing protein [Haladaptatus halobius]